MTELSSLNKAPQSKDINVFMMLQKPWDGNRVKYILMQLQCSK